MASPQPEEDLTHVIHLTFHPMHSSITLISPRRRPRLVQSHSSPSHWPHSSFSSSGHSPLTAIGPAPRIPHPAGLTEVPRHVSNGQFPPGKLTTNPPTPHGPPPSPIPRPTPFAPNTPPPTVPRPQQPPVTRRRSSPPPALQDRT